MKDRFHRLKQKKIAMQNKEMYQKFLQSLNKDRPRESATPQKTPTNMRDEYFDEDENEVKELLVEESSEDVFREARKIQALIEKKIKDRIIKGKLAYSVMPFKAVSIMPKATENQIRESYEIYHQTTFKNSTVATQAKSVVVTRENLPKARLTVISSPPKMGHRRVGSDVLPPLIQPPINDIPYRAESISLPKEIENASFMASTISFMSKLGTNESYRSSRRRNPIKKLGDKHFLNNTMTQSLKKEAKRSASVEPQWAPVGGAKEKYTLGIYNNNFKEKS